MNLKIVPILVFCTCNAYTKIVLDASKIGGSVPEYTVRTNGKLSQIEQLLGQTKKSNGIKALRLKDISEILNKKRKEKKQSEKIHSEKIKKVDKDYFIVSQVNEHIITNVDILNSIRFVFFASGRQYDPKIAKLMVDAVLDSLIEDKIRLVLAKRNGVVITDKILNQQVEEIAKNNNMTVDRLKEEFEIAGIDLNIFKKNLFSKIIFSEFFNTIARGIKCSKQTIDNMKEKIKSEMKENRYRFNEIFLKVNNKQHEQQVLEKAEAILELLQQGFNFEALKQSVSQSSSANKIEEVNWIKESVLDKQTYEAIKDLKPGEFSGVIKLNTGYKIVLLLDKAEAGKVGFKQMKYKVLMTSIDMPKIITQEENVMFSNKMNFIAQANSLDEFKNVCNTYKLKIEEKEIVNPNPYEFELIKRNKERGTTGILQLNPTSPFTALFVISEEVPDVKLPDDEEIKQLALHKKAVRDFDKTMQLLSANTSIKINKKLLSKVVNEIS